MPFPLDFLVKKMPRWALRPNEENWPLYESKCCVCNTYYSGQKGNAYIVTRSDYGINPLNYNRFPYSVHVCSIECANMYILSNI
jgi:hypothetical protein